MDRNGADRIVDAEVFERIDSPDYHEASADADEEGADRVDPVAGTGDRNQASQESVGRQRQIPLLRAYIRVDQRGQSGRASSERRVEGHPSNASRVEGGERAARVEAVPAEPQDQAARRSDDEIVRRHRAATVPLEHSAQSRTKCDRPSQ